MLALRRPVLVKGLVRFWRNGVLVVDRPNLTVTAGTAAYAELLGGGSTSAWSALAFAVGSGSTAPAKTDTDLTAVPKYYRSVAGAATFPSGGTVSLPVAITSTDYAAYNITIAEIGLYANSGAAVLPAVVGSAFPSWAATTAKAVGATVLNASSQAFTSVAPSAWQAGHAYASGVLITDSNGNIQQVTTPGTSGGTHPTWATSVSSTTTDGGTLVWTCRALSGYTPTTGSSTPTWVTSAIGSQTYDGTVAWQYEAATVVPTPMLAHAIVPAFTFTGAANYTGTWNLTFGV
jgi:hypothetical protein